jgi:hypothetical protein
MSEVRGFICRSILDEMNACFQKELEKEAIKLKDKIERGRKGSAMDPQDYQKELEVNFKRRNWLIDVHSFLKKQCPE